MQLSSDLADFLRCLLDAKVRFLVVGGYAVGAHGHSRYTKDLDVWVWIDAENRTRIVDAIGAFGFGSLGLSEQDFAEPNVVVQLGRPPRRIDILTGIDGIEFDDAWGDHVESELSGLLVPIIGTRALALNKRASGRLQDLADLEALGLLDPDD